MKGKKKWRKCGLRRCNKTPLQTETSTQKTLTHKVFYTKTQRLLYTKSLHTDAFTHRHLLHTNGSTHSDFYTRTLFTHRSFYTQTLLHKQTLYTQLRQTKSHYSMIAGHSADTQTLFHTNPFTYRQTLTDTRFYTQTL